MRSRPTVVHSYANSPVMRHIENQIRAAVESGETIQYSVTPRYNGSDKNPHWSIRRGIRIRRFPVHPAQKHGNHRVGQCRIYTQPEEGWLTRSAKRR
ncbi:hypothetical protein ACH5AI_25130 [Streptomyces collinus]|uniref:hypothetical protein n=1 Tax=Streptomyces collinus TaxID=42684 RepID=UPI0037BDC78F